MSPSASTPGVLDLLVEHYRNVPAPAPNAELLARMDDDHDAISAVVIPFTPRPRIRLRYLVAATLAAFIATSSLAVAGVLPDGLQRRIASVASEFGIDLPSPGRDSTPVDSNGSDGKSRGTDGGSRGGTGTGTGGGTPAPPTTSGSGAGVVPQLTPPPTTLPPTVTVPALPPVDVPPLPLPPVTLPPIELPLRLPGL